MNNRAKYEELSQRLQNSEGFKCRFIKEPKTILIEMGFEVPDSIEIKVHEDTATVRNIVIPVESNHEDETTASNPFFRKVTAKAHADEKFKAELINNPKSMIAKLTGKYLPEDLDVIIHENSSTVRHLIIFVDSATEELSERELETVAGGLSWTDSFLKPIRVGIAPLPNEGNSNIGFPW